MPPPQSTTRRTEEILVLYGSQTGNSEQAAKQVADEIPSRLSASDDGFDVTARHMQLDDFIEIERARWPRLVVVVTSSYGVGQAPLGCYKFREMCDFINENGEGEKQYSKLFDGVTYAMLGLGDSKYTTFFRNPTVIDSALTAAGARRVGPLGKADASGEGEDEQGKVISRWIDGIWKELRAVLRSEPPTDETMEKVHGGTVELCGKIFEDFQPPAEGGMLSAVLMICVPVGIAAIIAALKGTLFT